MRACLSLGVANTSGTGKPKLLTASWCKLEQCGSVLTTVILHLQYGTTGATAAQPYDARSDIDHEVSQMHCEQVPRHSGCFGSQDVIYTFLKQTLRRKAVVPCATQVNSPISHGTEAFLDKRLGFRLAMPAFDSSTSFRCSLGSRRESSWKRSAGPRYGHHVQCAGARILE